MPQPRSVQYGDAWLPVRGGFQVTWVAYRNPVLDRAVSRFQKDVARRTGLDVGRTGPRQLPVNCRGKDRGYLTINTNEQYSLTDAGNRQRMAARLAPGESEQVELPPELVAPVRSHAHNHVGTVLLKGEKPTQQDFNELANAASPDSLVPRRFELDAERFVRGDRSDAAALQATLASWRDNEDRLAAVAKGIRSLKPRCRFPLTSLRLLR